MIDFGPPPFVFPKPAIIRPVTAELLKYGGPTLAMPFTPGFRGKATPPTPIGVTYIGEAGHNGSGQQNLDFGSFTIPVDGLMVVLFVGDAGFTSISVSSVGIGGTNVSPHFACPSDRPIFAIASRVVTAGSRNVTVNLSGATASLDSGAACSVYLLTDYESATPLDADGNGTRTSTTTRTLTFDIPALGVALYMFGKPETTDLLFSSATQRFEGLLGDEMFSIVGDKQPDTDLTAHVETVTMNSGTNTRSYIGGVWR